MPQTSGELTFFHICSRRKLPWWKTTNSKTHGRREKQTLEVRSFLVIDFVITPLRWYFVFSLSFLVCWPNLTFVCTAF